LHQQKIAVAAIKQRAGLQKLRHYCAYQERSHDRKQKTIWLRITPAGSRGKHFPVDGRELSQKNVLRLHSPGKVQAKQWGRVKIEYELKQKR
jgi:regulatory protein